MQRSASLMPERGALTSLTRPCTNRIDSSHAKVSIAVVLFIEPAQYYGAVMSPPVKVGWGNSGSGTIPDNMFLAENNSIQLDAVVLHFQQAESQTPLFQMQGIH